jgi:lysophospholipid acyltransferase (LPLAT)-like uncharacterized protein
MLKKLLRSEIGQAVLSWLIVQIISLTGKSIRWEHINVEVRDRFADELAPAVGVFWHNRIMLMTEAWRFDLPVAMLQSPHPDGQVIARAIQSMGFQTVWGSSTKGKGGAAGLRNLIKTLRAGTSIAFTPDGPRGPRMRMSVGVIAAARMSGRPILPGAWSVQHRKVLNTWDRFILARPFSRGVMVWGEPIYVPKDLDADDFERYRKLAEDCLNEVSEIADRHFGHVPIEPAPPAAPTPPIAPEPPARPAEDAT